MRRGTLCLLRRKEARDSADERNGRQAVKEAESMRVEGGAGVTLKGINGLNSKNRDELGGEAKAKLCPH